MRALIQRVTKARVEVNNLISGEIGTGLLVFLGIKRSDSAEDADYLVDKVLGIRIFPDEIGRMNRSVAEASGSILVVSQFTLYSDCRRGRRPSFDDAAPAEQALSLYNYFVESITKGPVPVRTGVFQAQMDVSLVNDGPVTIMLDSADRRNRGD
jgi:D-tyrosyl-tRNA(Tyr) deacylase